MLLPCSYLEIVAMSTEHRPNTDQAIPISDLTSLLWRNKFKMALFCIFVSLLVAGVAALRPTRYVAEASFHNKGSKPFSGGSNIMSMLSGLSGGSQDATIPLFKSKRIWETVVEKFDLHVKVNEKRIENSRLNNIRANIITEIAYLQGGKHPVFPRQSSALLCHNVSYTGETPITLEVEIAEGGTLSIQSPQNVLVAQGQLNQQIVLGDDGELTFTLSARSGQNLEGRTFILSVAPIGTTAEQLAKRLDVKPDKDGDNILLLTFSYDDRHLVSELTNALMDEYHGYLEGQNKTLAASQLDYLRQRQNESAEDLKRIITDHAVSVSHDFADTGVIESQRELEALLRQKELSKERLLGVDLNLRRLRTIGTSGDHFFESLGTLPNLPPLVSRTISDINTLKLRRDGLQLAMYGAPESSQTQLTDRIDTQVSELHNLEQNQFYAQQLKLLLESETSLPAPESLAEAVPTLFKLWYTKVWQKDPSTENTPDKERHRSTLVSYLDNYLRSSQVHERLIRERITHQRNPDRELQGVDLESANKLHVSMIVQVHDVEAEIRQTSFVLEQVKDEEFEISSLSGTLKDPVSNDIIKRYSALSMSLKDDTIHSEKEQERIREELSQQRVFLLSHLKQTNQLLHLRKEFLEEKVAALQETMLDLIQQKVSVSAKHLEDYAQAHIDQLEYERGFISSVLEDIDKKLAVLPAYWATEEMIKYQTVVNKSIVEEVSKLVETKNISHNLETVLSGPVDHAVSPILPKRPHLLLFAILGAFLGAAISGGFVLMRGVTRGLPASRDSLQLAGQHVAGALPSRKKQRRFKPESKPHQRDTLRRLATKLCTAGDASKRLLLLTGDGADYSEAFAQQLSHLNGKVLLVRLGDTASESVELQVTEADGYDVCLVGDTHVDGTDHLLKILTHNKLTHFEERYTWIVVAHQASPASADAEALAAFFTKAAATVHGESLRDLSHLWSYDRQVLLSFVLV